MPGQQTRTRQQCIIPYQLNSQVQSPQLGLGMLYRELYLTLYGTVSSPTTTFLPTTLKPGDELAAIQRIDVLVNGSDIIASFTGEELSMWNTIQLGRPRDLTSINPSSGSGTMSFYTSIILPFWDKTSHTPIDTMLNSAKLSDLRINVQWGGPNDIVGTGTNNDATFTVAPNLMVSSRECFGISGDFSVWRRFRLVDTNVIANDQYTVNLPLGNVYRGFLINTKDSNGLDLTGAIDRVKLVSGTNVYFDLDYKTMLKTFRSNVRNVMANPDVLSTGKSGNSFPFIANSSSSKLDAWGFLDLVDDGYLTEAIDTIALSELKLQFKTNTTIGKFAVLPSQIIPVRKPKG